MTTHRGGRQTRLVRENHQLRDKVRRAERAIREGRSWDDYQADEATLTATDGPA